MRLSNTPTEKSPTRPAELSFYEELQLMPYQQRCIVLGIVMGENEGLIRKTLNLTCDDFDQIVVEHKLFRWKFFRALIDA
jgi:hypothetical protein